MPVTHSKVSTIPDGTDTSVVRPSDWNADHVVSLAPSDLPTITLTGDVTGDGAGGTIPATLADTAVTPGSYTNTNLTVDAKGRITAASNGSSGGTVTSVALASPNSTITLSGTNPITGSGTIDVDIADTSVTPGSYTSADITVDATGRITAASNGATNVTGPSSSTDGDIALFSGTSGKIIKDAGIGLPAADGQLIIGSSAGPAALATLTAGANITITPGHNSISIAASGGGSSAVLPPQGRLTLQSGHPVMTADVTAATTIYYDTYIGNQVPVWNGSSFTSLAIGSDEISMGLDAVTPHVAANSLYDVFGINNSGTLVIAVGPAWLNTATVTITIATPAVITWTAHGLQEGAPVIFTNSGGALPTGITAGTTYFVGRSPATNTFNISTTVANAADGTFVATSGSQSGTQTGTNHTSIRGTGAGTTQLSLQNGIWTNTNALTHAWGGGSGTTDYGSVSANQATYLGTLYATANGQTTMQFAPVGVSGGTNTIIGIWNAYNREPASSTEHEGINTWTYGTSTWRPMNGSTGNRINYIDGLGQGGGITANHIIEVVTIGTAAGVAEVGVNLDSTNATPLIFSVYQSPNNANNAQTVMAEKSFPVLLGWHYMQRMELASGATITFGSFSGQREAGKLSYSY